MRAPRFTSAFKRDYKTAEKRGNDIKKFEVLLDILLEGLPVPPKYQNHPLKWKYAGLMDCHIEPDWLLLYAIEDDAVVLVRMGTHSDLFD